MSGQDLSKILITSQTCVDSIVVDFEDIAYLDEFVTVPFQDRQTMPNTEGPRLIAIADSGNVPKCGIFGTSPPHSLDQSFKDGCFFA